jgi:nitrile hydratase
MKLQHHVGGLEGLGNVTYEKRPFVQPWEKRIFGIHVAMMGLSQHLKAATETPTTFKDVWTWADLRKGAEGMNPFDYFKYRYYEKWLAGISGFFVGAGYLSKEELEAKTAAYLKEPDAPLPSRPEAAVDNQVIAYLRSGDSPKCAVEAKPAFKVGDPVIVGDPPQSTHTKLPGYLRNKRGTIDVVYDGAYNYFCATGDGVGAPMPVYCVRFDSRAIWNDLTESRTSVYADLFEAYLKAP